MKSIRIIVMGCLLLTAARAHAMLVGTELTLLADISGSLSDTDFNLQRDGYEAAFRDAGVIAAIEMVGGIAASLAYWSDSATLAVGWTHITDAASANAFADAIAAAPRTSGGGTAMANALDFGAGLFADNGFESDNQVIDVSGDGAESEACSSFDEICLALQDARDAALLAGVDRINALWIEDEAQPSIRNFFCLDPGCAINPLEYGSINVIGGDGAFQNVVSGFDAFSSAIVSKIEREINPMPLPSTLLLVGFGLVGLRHWNRHRQRMN